MYVNIVMRFFFLFFLITFSSFGQLHHSSIGISSSNTNNKGFSVLQSIGQLSPIGNYNSQKQAVFQGYQQPLGQYGDIDRNHIFDILAFPNPFQNDLNFEFENIKPSEIRVDIYDIAGRYIDSYFASDFGEILRLKLENLISTEYIFRLIGPGINYSTKIIKK